MRAFVLGAALAACSRPSPSQSANGTSSAASGASPSVTASTAPPTAALKAGDVSPPLVATAADGSKVDLAAWKGKHVVVYFYPKDDTPGCTQEACAFRDAWERLEKAGVKVVGVSVDDDTSHKAFAAKHKLPFALVADTDQAICKRFGVEVSNGTAKRVSFLIGPDGKLKKIYPKVDPGVHVDQILVDTAASTG